MGMPFFSYILTGMLYTLNWLIFLLEVPTALLVIQFLSVCIAMAGMYFYAQYRNLAMPASVIAVAIFAYTVFTEVFHPALGSAMCWFPAILLMTRRYFDTPSFPKTVFSVIPLALFFFVNFPKFFGACLILAVYFLVLHSLVLAMLAWRIHHSSWFYVSFIVCRGSMSFALWRAANSIQISRLIWVIALIIFVDISFHRDNRFKVPLFVVGQSSLERERIESLRRRNGFYRMLLLPQDLAEAFYPGWQAYVGGKSTSIYRASSLFRAVEVSPGKHSVEFRYSASTLYWGIVVTLLSAGLIVLILGRPVSKRRTAISREPKRDFFRCSINNLN